ncbi:MAG: hypothetical protein IPM48_05910 [Saprospiraceae bacterium]|nr:hypothetical protein [Saprospiraceae bacterium]
MKKVILISGLLMFGIANILNAQESRDAMAYERQKAGRDYERGRFSKAEIREMKRDHRKLRAYKRAAKADGYISRREANQLRKMENRIYHKQRFASKKRHRSCL